MWRCVDGYYDCVGFDVVEVGVVFVCGDDDGVWVFELVVIGEDVYFGVEECGVYVFGLLFGEGDEVFVYCCEVDGDFGFEWFVVFVFCVEVYFEVVGFGDGDGCIGGGD